MSWRFGLVADPHYADTDPRGIRYYRQSAEKLQEFIDSMNREGVDFVVELGDLKDQDVPPVESDTLRYLETIERIFAGFRGPRYHVLGNHDCDSLSKQQFLAAIGNTGQERAAAFYSFDCRGLHAVVLDANYREDGAEYDHGNFDWRDTWIPEAQLEGLREDLAASEGPVLVFVHQQLDGEGDHAVNNAAEVRRILEQSGRVQAVFQGHQHAGGLSCIEGIPYVTLKAMVDRSGPENSAYALVEYRADGVISVSGCRREEDRLLNPV